MRLDAGCTYRPLVVTAWDETWTVHTLISHRPNDLVAFPACDTLPGELVLTGVRVNSGGSRMETLPPGGGGEITDEPIRVSGTGENVRVGISLHAPGYTNLRFDGEDGIGSVFKSFSLDEGCHRFDVDISYGSSSVRKDLYVMVSPDGTGDCSDDTGGNGGNGGNDGTGNGAQTGGAQTSTPTTPPSRSGGGGGSGGTGGGGFFIPPSFPAPSTSAPSTQSEPEPEPLPTLNGTIPHLRMISVPHMDMWNGTTITPFQCNVTDGGTLDFAISYDGMVPQLTYANMTAGMNHTAHILGTEPYLYNSTLGDTITYNVTMHAVATYNVTEIQPYTVMLDIHAGGYDWRINEDSLAAFQDIFDAVDVLARYQYGSVQWTAQGGSCWMPQTP